MTAPPPKESLRPGVPLDADQTGARRCAFLSCLATCDTDVLYLVVIRDEIYAVCERCYRTRLRGGDQKGPPA